MGNHMRSTDRDLLVAQRVLSTLRFPTRTELVQRAQVRDTAKAQVRFVQEKFGDGTLKTVQPHKTKMLANYDMRVSFQLNNIPFEGEKYKGIIHFLVKDCVGEGMTKAACIQDATERFRQYLVTGLRTQGTNLRTHFFDNAIITMAVPNELTPVESDTAAKVAEKLRVWIGNELWKLDTKIRKQFVTAVKSEEVRFTRICSACGISKVTHNFNLKHLKASKQWVCLECMPKDPNEEDEDMPEDEDEKGENKDNDENPEDELEDEDEDEDAEDEDAEEEDDE